MKTTCFGCKALDNVSHSPCCDLGYNIKTVFNARFGRIDTIKPLEDCPKPTSTKKLFTLLVSDKKV